MLGARACRLDQDLIGIDLTRQPPRIGRLGNHRGRDAQKPQAQQHVQDDQGKEQVAAHVDGGSRRFQADPGEYGKAIAERRLREGGGGKAKTPWRIARRGLHPDQLDLGGVGQGAGMDLSTDTTMEMVFVLKQNEDGTYTLNVDRDALKTSLQTYIDALIPVAVEMIYQQLEDQGMNRADIDEAMAAEGVTVEEYVQQMMDASIDVDQMMDGLADENESGYFRAAKGKLYLSDKADTFSDDSCAEYTLSGGTMQWTGGSYELFDNLDDLHVELPVQWVKQ